MATQAPCANVEIKYKGTGTQKLFTFPFTYIRQSHIHVSLWDDAKKEYVEVPETGWGFANATTIEFNVAPPVPPSSSTFNVKITRRTSLDKIEAQFYPGSAIRAEDLNSDFDQLRLAIQENRCELYGTVSELLATRYWNKLSVTTPDDKGDTLTKVDQEEGRWVASSDKYIATSDAISARLDPYVQDTKPADLVAPKAEQAGKSWFDQEDLVERYWDPDADAWVTLANTGPEGPVGPSGGVSFKGNIDITLPPPSGVIAGDQFANVTQGNPVAEFTGLVGPIGVGDLILFTGTRWVSQKIGTPVAPGSITDIEVSDAADIKASKLSFTQAGTGATVRTVDSKLKDVVSVKDFGAVADGDFATGAGTDNTAAFQAAINSHTAPGKGGASVYVPRGVYKLAGQITVPAGVTIYGDGKWSSIVFCPLAFADLTGLVRLNGAGGPPTGIHSLGILAQTGGAPGRGLVIVSNGSFASDLWVNGFALGIHIDSTDVFLSDFAAELSTTNVYISQSNVGVSHGTVYGGINGMTIANNAAVSPGTVHITSVRATSCDQIGFAVSAGKDVVFAGCSVDHDNVGKITDAGFKIDASTNVTLTGCAATIGAGKSTTAAGVKIVNSTNIGISATSASGFLDGLSSNACGNVRVSGSSFTNNGRSGCWLQGGDNITVTGNTFLNDGAVGSVQEYGINSANVDANSTHLIVGNICSQASGAGHLQDYGIVANAGPTSTTIISGNVCRFNGTSDIYLASQTGRVLLDGNIADNTNATPPAVASAAALTLPPGATFVSITGADNITSINAAGFGRKSVTLVFAATATVTKGGNLKIASTLTATPDDTLTLYCDGTNWIEVSRSVN